MAGCKRARAGFENRGGGEVLLARECGHRNASTLNPVAATRVHLPNLTDQEVFAYAAEACSRFRRFAAYGMLLYLPMSAMALTLVNPPTAAATWMGTGTGVLGVVLVLGSVNMRSSPRIGARAIIGALALMFPLILVAAGGWWQWQPC